MRIGKKFIHHASLLGALVAPAVYLFGSMFMGLAGAHGEELWAQEGGQTEYWVEYEGDQYKYLDLSEYWGTGAYSQGGEFYIQLGLDDTTDFFGKVQIYGNVIPTEDGFSDGTLTYSNVYYDGFNWNYIPNEYTYRLDGADQEYEPSFNVCWCMWSSVNLNSQTEMALYTEYFLKVNHGTKIVGYISQDSGQHYEKVNSGYEQYGELSINNGNKSAIQFGSGEKARLASIPDFPDGQPLINYNWHSETYNQNYTDGIFGNFFPRQNFLEKWGSDAISDNPVGFAPFGQLFRYLDDNMLHFGLNGNQAGLMAYGYMYWIGHVFIADLALCCLVFIPKLLRKIVDKVGGNDD